MKSLLIAVSLIWSIGCATSSSGKHSRATASTDEAEVYFHGFSGQASSSLPDVSLSSLHMENFVLRIEAMPFSPDSGYQPERCRIIHDFEVNANGQYSVPSDFKNETCPEFHVGATISAGLIDKVTGESHSLYHGRGSDLPVRLAKIVYTEVLQPTQIRVSWGKFTLSEYAQEIVRLNLNRPGWSKNMSWRLGLSGHIGRNRPDSSDGMDSYYLGETALANESLCRREEGCLALSKVDGSMRSIVRNLTKRKFVPHDVVLGEPWVEVTPQIEFISDDGARFAVFGNEISTMQPVFQFQMPAPKNAEIRF